MTDLPIPPNATACLLLADGAVFFGESIGAEKMTAGELCFNTAMTGYQEILTDPSYAGQIITFTAPHIGNVGCNEEDVESSPSPLAGEGRGEGAIDKTPSNTKPPHPNLPPQGGKEPRNGAIGLVLRERPTLPSNFRSRLSLDDWLKKNNIGGICGIDTRALTKYIRKHGAQNAVIFRLQAPGFRLQQENAKKLLAEVPNMKGLDLAKSVSTTAPYIWNESLWRLFPEARSPKPGAYHVVAIDYGIKHNILRHLAERGCKVTVVPATTRAEDILKLKPDGIFLSNGPGDPAATGQYAIPEIKKLINSPPLTSSPPAGGIKGGVPIFGICLGHQLLGIALGGKTEKMKQGHRGANHPVKNLITGNVEITSQNHGFAVSRDGLPSDVEITHISLFDGTIQGLRHKTKPIFCVQGHPEASPGPHDSQYLFDQFVEMIKRYSLQSPVASCQKQEAI